MGGSMNIIHLEWPEWFTGSFVEKLIVRIALIYLVGSDKGMI
jgi:hypothetical protein|tara:strand:+ start:18 stop:143 length:126 start_codon:yes stop_codon:yes gene_type:complete